MAEVRLGLRANALQFSLLVALNALVGSMVGLERSVMPLIGEREFGLTSKAAILAFVLAFGLSKAITNLFSGSLAERHSRRRMLIIGWALALPVPLLIGLAPTWHWIVVANLFLGVNQGLAWSMTVVMKIDLVGPARRGLALGLNEAAGYIGVALMALATGAHVRLEQRDHGTDGAVLGLGGAIVEATLRNRPLRASCQAGLVNNLNDALAWGLAPLYLAATGASLREIAIVAAAYPLVWGVGQLGTGWLSDSVGRKPLIVLGMLVQAVALGVLAIGAGAFAPSLAAALLLGVGTAMVYPTLIAAVADNSQPRDRARIVSVYRFWRDFGFVLGALVAGVLSDLISAEAAIVAVAVLTAASGMFVAATRWR